MFQYVDGLIVSDFCELLSDAHNPVSLTLNIFHTIQPARSYIYLRNESGCGNAKITKTCITSK